MDRAELPVTVHVIAAGKLRRYHGISLWEQLRDISTILLNIRDLFFIGLGVLQSLWLMIRWRPDAVFTKGGFVCVPIGVAARLLNVPLVMHDSDTHPGLANRILARWAKRIATGSPLKYYSYPHSRSKYVGIPIDASFKPLDEPARAAARTMLGLPDIARPLVVVTGGGLGAQRINDAILRSIDELTEDLGLAVLHITGQNDFERCQRHASSSVHYLQVPFISKDMAKVLGSADIVVTRAGATTMLELAALKACVIAIPHPYLTGGHQLKNAKVYEDADAVIVIQEANLKQDEALLVSTIGDLIRNPDRRHELGANLGAFARPEAAADVAKMIIEVAD